MCSGIAASGCSSDQDKQVSTDCVLSEASGVFLCLYLHLSGPLPSTTPLAEATERRWPPPSIHHCIAPLLLSRPEEKWNFHCIYRKCSGILSWSVSDWPRTTLASGNGILLLVRLQSPSCHSGALERRKHPFWTKCNIQYCCEDGLKRSPKIRTLGRWKTSSLHLGYTRCQSGSKISRQWPG